MSTPKRQPGVRSRPRPSAKPTRERSLRGALFRVQGQIPKYKHLTTYSVNVSTTADTQVFFDVLELDGERIDESPFSASTTSNWVARLGGLPPYIRGVTRGIMKSGHSFEDALPIAIGIMKTWAAGGPTYGHKSHATPATIAKASAALAHWEAMKGAAHSGASHRTELEVSSTRAGAQGGGAGAVAVGHQFFGNQHTGSLGKNARKKVAGQVAKSQSQIGKVNTSGLAGAAAAQAAHVVQQASVPGATAAKVTSGTTPGALTAYQAQQLAQQKVQALNAVSQSTAEYNSAKDSVGLTANQQKQNVDFTTSRIHATASAQQNEQGQQQISAVKTQADTSNAQAQDKLKEAQVKLEGAMAYAGYRDAGMGGGFVGEGGTSGAANFLPTGPSYKQDKRITKRLKEPQTRPQDRDPDKISSTHWFQGEDREHCEQCGLAMTDPKHEKIDAYGRVLDQPLTPTVTTARLFRQGDGFVDPPEDASSPWHAFEGLDLMHCDICQGAIQEPQHAKGSGQGTNVQEAAESAPGVPPVAIPDQEEIVRSPERRLYGSRTIDGPEEHLSVSDEAHELNLKNVNLVEEPLAAALKSHFDEQKRATINRLLGKRGGRMLKRAAEELETRRRLTKPLAPQVGDAGKVGEAEMGRPERPKKEKKELKSQRDGDIDDIQVDLDPSDVFDQAFWSGKTASVLEPHLQRAASMAHSSVKTQVNAPSAVADELGLDASTSEMSSRAHEAARAVTSTTAHELAAALQQGVARGETRLEIRARLEHVFEVAEAARAAQIARTQVTGAYNQSGLTYARHLPNGMVGTKVWLARQDEDTRPEHRAANGQPQHLDKPFVAGGVHLDYPGDTRAPLDEWINCVVEGTEVEWPSLLQTVFRRRYEGDVVQFTTANGRVLTVTPNHPVLTRKGWVAAQFIHEGDELGSAVRVEGGTQPHVDDLPRPVQQVYGAACEVWPQRRIGGSRMDFHGDGIGDQDVSIVGTQGDLTPEEQIGESLLQHLDDRFFVGLGMAHSALPYLSPGIEPGTSASGSSCVRTTPSGSISSGSISSTFLGAHGAHSDGISLRSTSNFQPELLETSHHSGPADSELSTHSEHGHFVSVELTKVIKVNVLRYSGHVYNLQTQDGWYVSNGIITHNCRCTQAFMPPGADLGAVPPEAAVYSTAYIPPTS